MSNFKTSFKENIKLVLSSFSKKEWYIFLGLIFILFISTLGILQKINKSFMVWVPMLGGSITEGVIGVPRFINPILANSLADRDMVALIYSGLMRKGPAGNLIPDLAEKYEISKNGLSYTFTLKDNVYFQDDEPVTASDVVFTIEKVKDATIKSPQKGNWDGISIEKIDEKTVKFILKQPYASFLESVTLGILPEHLWNNTPIELNEANTNPVGSGPYMIEKVSKQQGGVIDYYDLAPFKKFSLGKPYLKRITLRFYPNEDDSIKALLNKEIDQLGSITPLNAESLKEKNYRLESSVLPRIFGLFFNQNQNQLFTDKNIILAMDQAIDKEGLIREVLLGYGVAIDNPIPPNMSAYQNKIKKESVSPEERIEKAQALLAKSGWQKGTDGFLEKTIIENKKKTVIHLEFSISTSNAPELAKSAELVKQNLEAVGMKVEIKTFEIGNLNQSVIRPRKYDVLLFGQIINHESDLFAFWHSSQRKDPGLNVAMYTSARADKILEDAFITADESSRIKKYAQFEEEIKKDMPAVFLYSPDFIYEVSEDLKGLSVNYIASPADRFLNVYSWYKETDNIWKVFAQ